jgi:hypothetical protein
MDLSKAPLHIKQTLKKFTKSSKKEKDGAPRITAHELFSQFTAGIIKKNVVFTR